MKRLAALGAMRLSLAVKGRVEDSFYEKYPSILTTEIGEEEILYAETYGFDSYADEPEISTVSAHRIDNLMRLLGDDVVARSLLELLALLVIEPSAGEILDTVAPGNGEGVTLLTAARAAGYYGRTDSVLLPCHKALETVSFFFREAAYTGDRPYYLVPYKMDDWLIGFLSGSDDLDKAFSDFVEIVDPEDPASEVFGMDETINFLTKSLEKLGSGEENEDAGVSVIVSGEKESGRFSAVKAASAKLMIPLLAVDFAYLLGTLEPKEVIRRLVRTCALWGRALVVKNITVSGDTVFMVDRIEYLYTMYCVAPLFLLTVPEVKLVPSIRSRYISVKIPANSVLSLDLWKGFLPARYSDLAVSLASKMTLTAGQVKRVCSAIETEEAVGKTIDSRLICKLCYDVLDDGRYDNIKRVEPGFSLDDLKIDDHNRRVLEDIVRQVELRQKVYDEWNLKKRYAYGRCVSVILAGPPGTGKTMTVHALAGQLGLELYKVDLSQIVDKYVGETEKRLEEVFTKAQKSNMILFFDEADAVMSKRSEVKDSKDKYANTEISFILQRIEEYDGIVLLATNNLQNIDTAFMRRIRYVVNFKLPDRETRKEIWKGAFGKGVPVADDIDYDFLAEKFELSGGEIKNIVLNAVFYGAADGGIVGMSHVMKAVYRENTKLKRIAFDGDYGGYAYLLHD